MQRSDYLTTESVPRALLRFSIPVILSSIFQVLYSAVDLIVIGHFAETAAISGVSVSGQLMTTVAMILSGLTTGVTVLLGQYAGAKNEADIKKTVGTAITLFAALALVVMSALLIFRDSLISILNTPPEAVHHAVSYLTITAFGTPFIMGFSVLGSIFRGSGDSKSPFLFIATACTTNIILDLLFVAVLKMDAAGAALATVIAQGVSLGLSAFRLAHRGIGVKITLKDIRFSLAQFKRILLIGVPLCMQDALVSLSFLFITSVINSMGLTQSTAAGIVEKLTSFLMMPSIAISVSVATMSAHCVGAGLYKRAMQVLRTAISIALGFAVVIVTFVWIRGDLLIRIFKRDDMAVIEQAVLFLRSYSLDCLVVAFVFNFNSFFSSCNRSIFSMVHSILTTICIRVPFVYFAAKAGASLATIGLAAPLSTFGSLLLCIGYFIYLGRKGTFKTNATLPVPEEAGVAAAISEAATDAVSPVAAAIPEAATDAE
jgi:putative MATE family efflux protein